MTQFLEIGAAAVTAASRKLRVNGIELNVAVHGEGPALLLVHGFPDDMAVWRRQVPALVIAGYQVIVPDMRGYGRSDAPAARPDYRIDLLVADLVGVLDALGVARTQLIGHDWGAAICWQFCMRHPERVERYAALSVGHPNAYARGPLEQKIKGYYVLLFQLRGLAEWALRSFDWSLFRAATGQHPECVLATQWLARPGRLTAALNYYRANLGIFMPRAYPPVTVPVLGIWSSGDKFLAEKQMLDCEKLVEGSWRYERIDGASHWLQLDDPVRVNALLLDFLHSSPTESK
ncbi:alpha/beta fold hydrolase [Ramlibacter sp. WS9]|uniref:alpha/beta fold hydrolase n=1 Tax=Ramlibacter sp. WS9 TaxID=1882741 RepID=UPI001143853D|nr:alpha/beta fold hydrolase [Ramlibacter sp. WS9]ROZ75792.1 alpha/beta hydrolase [Ramlibacter sp. WS9]